MDGAEDLDLAVTLELSSEGVTRLRAEADRRQLGIDAAVRSCSVTPGHDGTSEAQLRRPEVLDIRAYGLRSRRDARRRFGRV